jgi:hypothetical protein
MTPLLTSCVSGPLKSDAYTAGGAVKLFILDAQEQGASHCKPDSFEVNLPNPHQHQGRCTCRISAPLKNWLKILNFWV